MNELNKACFPHDGAYSNTKDLAMRAISDKVLKERAYETDKYQRALASMVYTFFDKNTGSGTKSILNEELAKELHKPVTKNLKKGRVYVRFKDNISATDLAEIGLLSSKICTVKCLSCWIDIFTNIICLG